MKRDGATESIWQNSVVEYQPTNNWDKAKVYDVLIVGGGITGLTTALLLQSKGQKCILAEAVNIGFGTSGGTTAHLNTVLDTSYDIIEKDFGKEGAQMVAHATREAIDQVEELITQYHIDADFRYEPGYLVATTDEEAEELTKIAEASINAGIITDCADFVPINIPFKKACRFEFQARIHPTRYLTGLAQAYEGLGGVLLQQCMVNKVKHEKRFIADTSLGEIQANRLVYATHIPPGINLMDFYCSPYRSYVQAFTLKSGHYPEGLIYDMKEPYNYYRTHEVNGKKYIIAGGFDHKTGHEVNTDKIFTEQEFFLRKIFDVEQIDYRWSSQYFNSIDGLPYIGVMPGSEHTYIATGFGGNGMILGTLAGKMITDMILGNDNAYASLFSTSRVKPVAGFADFVRENTDVISQFIGLRLSFKKINELVQLAPGEALLAKWEDKKVALYKDEFGKIHAVDPVCPHAKCIVQWNSVEKSWDCPCHGSRFACNGALLSGPAQTGLAQIKWEDIEGD